MVDIKAKRYMMYLMVLIMYPSFSLLTIVDRTCQTCKCIWMCSLTSTLLVGEFRLMVISWQCTCWKKHRAWRGLQGWLQNSMTLTVRTTSVLIDSMELSRCDHTSSMFSSCWNNICYFYMCSGTIPLQSKFLPSPFTRRPEISTWETLSSSAEACSRYNR